MLIFLISYIQSYFPPERTKKILGRFKGIGANAIGALLGTVTPFCSCSSIPIFMGFTRAGISSGVTFSFLISSPLVDIGAFILLIGAFGFPVAEALFAKGVGVGTILSFMMSVTALSFPSMVMLSKAVKPELTFWFVLIVVIGIMLIGFSFNALGFLFV